MRIILTPLEIRGLADRICNAFIDHIKDSALMLSLDDEVANELVRDLHEAVTIALGIDQVAEEFDLMLAADEALGVRDDVESGEVWPDETGEEG